MNAPIFLILHYISHIVHCFLVKSTQKTTFFYSKHMHNATFIILIDLLLSIRPIYTWNLLADHRKIHTKLYFSGFITKKYLLHTFQHLLSMCKRYFPVCFLHIILQHTVLFYYLQCISNFKCFQIHLNSLWRNSCFDNFYPFVMIKIHMLCSNTDNDRIKYFWIAKLLCLCHRID